MLDVHAPHDALHGWRDFLIHLTTITIGLLIALSLEGLVEWRHHRHLVHDAQASLHAEIKSNANGISHVLADLHHQEEALKHDVVVLNAVIATKKYPADKDMSVDFRIVTFDSVSWKTAQSTGALSYMPYDLAREYAGIYAQQDLLTASEQQAARDAVVSIGHFINDDQPDIPPTPANARAIKEKIEVLQGQDMIVDSMMEGLAAEYKHFLDSHPS